MCLTIGTHSYSTLLIHLFIHFVSLLTACQKIEAQIQG